MCSGGVLQVSLPQSTNKVWQASPQTSISQNSVCHRHRAAVLREVGGEGAHRDHDQGHVDDRQLPVAQQLHPQWLHVDHAQSPRQHQRRC